MNIQVEVTDILKSAIGKWREEILNYHNNYSYVENKVTVGFWPFRWTKTVQSMEFGEAPLFYFEDPYYEGFITSNVKSDEICSLTHVQTGQMVNCSIKESEQLKELVNYYCSNVTE